MKVSLSKVEVGVDKIYNSNDICEIIERVQSTELSRTRKGRKYYELPCAFDIETTSFYDNSGEKVSIMYEWTLAIGWNVIIGRTWEEFLGVYQKLCEGLHLNEKKRLIIYIHNLSFEFQFIRKLFDWKTVFSLDTREPVQAITVEGIEFRCSYLLSGYALAKLSDQLTKYKVNKMVGDLDYSLLRHSKTPLTNKEIGYCVNDVLVVIAYIYETIDREKSLLNIPLTKTGYVRDYCRKACMYNDDNKYRDKFKKYRNFIRSLTLDSETYKQLKRAFAGGFTHASSLYSGEILSNVDSFDFTSSYPFVMVSEKFPMSKPELIEITSEEELDYNLKHYCCLFDIQLTKVQSTEPYENYISESKCWGLKNATLNNGRIVKADELCMSVTELDFEIIEGMYEYEDITITNFRRFRKGYLPKDLVLSILQLYVNKTTLKGVEGMEIEYLQSKEKVNAVYGMTVTDICRDEIVYDEDNWSSIEGDIEKSLEAYNKSMKRFLFYPWGVWVTAYARYNLFTGILEFHDDYAYSDTDSLKVLNSYRHMDYIKRYNQLAIYKLKKAMEYHGIDFNMTRPKNSKGEVKQLGIWDFEGTYDKFKTLGAKRYIYTQKGELHITISGVNKKKGAKYLQDTYGEKALDMFDNELVFPPEHTGKMIHTYIDDMREGYLTDYLGNKAYYREQSGVHLENTDYTLSITDAYLKYIAGVKTHTK